MTAFWLRYLAPASWRTPSTWDPTLTRFGVARRLAAFGSLLLVPATPVLLWAWI